MAQLARAALANENGDFTRARSLLQELDVSAQETLPIDTMIKAALLAGDVYRNLGDSDVSGNRAAQRQCENGERLATTGSPTQRCNLAHSRLALDR